jgi:hypothetical protein
MSIWFEGSGAIVCSIQQVKESFANHGEHYVGVVGLMPGITSVELVEQGEDFVIIRTNEGVMHRTNISKQIEADRVVVEFDEEYQAGTKVTATSHYLEAFTTTNDGGVEHRAVISGVEAPGVLGFFYRKLGKSSIGNAVLASYKNYFESQTP